MSTCTESTDHFNPSDTGQALRIMVNQVRQADPRPSTLCTSKLRFHCILNCDQKSVNWVNPSFRIFCISCAYFRSNFLHLWYFCVSVLKAQKNKCRLLRLLHPSFALLFDFGFLYPTTWLRSIKICDHVEAASLVSTINTKRLGHTPEIWTDQPRWTANHAWCMAYTRLT